jgi:multidrug efflux system membrane fusion protein
MRYFERILRSGRLCLVAAGLFSAGCHKGPQAAPQMPPPNVTVNQPVLREVTDWDEYPARLEAVDSVEVRAKVSGYLKAVHFQDGAEVKKGDLLFEIDPQEYKAQYDHSLADLNSAQSKFELASNDWARAQRLFQDKTISIGESDMRNSAFHSAEAELLSSKAMAEMAAINLGYTQITSPIDGRIGRKMMTEGNLVNDSQGQTTLLATIVSLDPIYCYFDADEGAVQKYQKMIREKTGIPDGAVPCEIELESETGFPHHGVIDFMDNRVDPATGTLRIRGKFANPGPDRILQPGFFARARVPSGPKYTALLIPDLAVGTDQSQRFVLVVNDKSVVEYRPVKLGPEVDGLRVVREGLQSNDWVVVNGLMSARPGTPVNAARAAIGETPQNPPAVAGSKP